MNPGSYDERKNPFFCVFNLFCLKDNNELAHWVSHSKLRSLELDEFFIRTPDFDEKEESVTGKTEEKKNTETMMMTQMKRRMKNS